jgi:tetratricopeptide (TPR) repeat protein
MAAAIVALKRMRGEKPQDESLGLELAGLLAGSGNRLAAMALYDTLLSAPKSTEAVHLAAANFEIEGSQFNAAVALVEKGLERFPKSGRLYLLLGEAEAGRSEWKKAATAYRRASGLLPSSEEAELPLLDVEIAGADTAEALAIVRELAARPASRGLLMESASRATALKAPNLADSIYAGLVQRDTADVAAIEARAAVVLVRADTAASVALYRRVMQSDSSGPAAPLALLRLVRFSADSGKLLLRRAAWRGLENLQSLELQGAVAISGPTTARSLRRAKPVLEHQRVMRDLVEAALDTMVFKTSWGPDEFAQLRKAYPLSALLERYAADLAVRSGNNETALASYDRLLRQDAANVTIQRDRADLLERMGKPSEAIAGYARALDLTPQDEPTFRALLRLRESNGTLGDLLEQVRRLRIRLPESHLLGEHEVELLQRLDRVAEAQAVAKKLKEIKP